MRPGGRLAKPLSVAVLPFVNLDPDASNEYFSDGLTEQIIDALTNIEGLRVPARSSAFSFKGRRVDIHEIGSKLHAQMVLEGTVRKEGEKVRITITLSNVADGYTVWSRTYDRDIKDVLALQDEIAQATVAALRVKLAFAKTPARQTNDPQAYHLYLKGRYFQNLGASMVEAQKQAVAHFGQAIEKDPTYAVAYAALADAWFNIGVQDPTQPPEAFLNAEAAARKALKIDDTLSDAHASLANVLVSKWDWQGAETELRRAIELNPNNARARHQYASCLALTDRWKQALQEAERAQTLDWASPQVHGQFAGLLIGARQYDRAIVMARKALEMNPKVIASQNLLGRAYVQKGMLAEGVAEFEKAEGFGVRRSHWAASLVGLYVKSGRRIEAEKLVEMWKQRPRGEFGHSESMAMVYAGLGEKDEAFRWLDEAYREHWMRLPWIKISPEYDNLRSDPRFQALIKKMGL
jgi:adenylate cyclase